MTDSNTTNKSFVKMWHTLQENGVRNIDDPSFMLDLYNNKLLNFNISDFIDMSAEEEIAYKSVIFKECKKNIWFFFREIVRIPDPISVELADYSNAPRFTLTEDTMRMIWCYTNNISFTNKISTPSRLYCLCLLMLYDKYISNNNTGLAILDSSSIDTLYNQISFVNSLFAPLSIVDSSIDNNFSFIKDYHEYNKINIFENSQYDDNIFVITNNKTDLYSSMVSSRIIQKPNTNLIFVNCMNNEDNNKPLSSEFNNESKTLLNMITGLSMKFISYKDPLNTVIDRSKIYVI